jgi:calcium/calmodulin-dependent protein kinase I
VLFEKIKSGHYDADDPVWDKVSEDAKDLVARLLTVDAHRRLTAEEALRHPWLQRMMGSTGAKGPSCIGDHLYLVLAL